MTTKWQVTFRVDESAQVGRGHMSRCRALAEALLAAGAQISFYCQDVRADTKSALQRRGIRVVDLPDEAVFLSEDLSGEVVVVDGYQFGEDFWRHLLAAHPRRTVYIDDLRDMKYTADLVICYNEGVSAEQFRLAPNTRLLLGGCYLLLRPEIYRAALSTNRLAPRRAVMLAAGGTLQEKWVSATLTKMARVEPRATVFWVLSGQRLPSGKVVRRARLCPSRVRFFSGLNADEMLRLYRRARYLVAPASTIMLEAFAAGCPLISGWVAGNQRNSLSFYGRQGLIVNVGDLRRINHGGLSRARDRLKRGGGLMIRRQRAYIAAARTGIEEIVRAVLTSDDVASVASLDDLPGQVTNLETCPTWNQ